MLGLALLLCLGLLNLHASTASVDCKLKSKLELYSDGCCSENLQMQTLSGSQTQQACLELCAADPTCIAAEISALGDTVHWSRNATYACSLLTGAADTNIPKLCEENSGHKRCYKKQCIDEPAGDIATIALPITERNHCERGTFAELVHFHSDYDSDSGCCLFEDMYQKFMGNMTIDQCKQACQTTSVCVAADIRRQKGKHYLPDLFECYNYYGEGNDFRTGCASDDIVATCYRKKCRHPTTTTTTVTFTTAACRLGNVHLVAPGFCDFDGFYARNIDVSADQECQDKCNEDELCIAADIRSVELTPAVANDANKKLCRLLYGEGKNFTVIEDKSDKSHKCYRKYCTVGCMSFKGYGCCRFEEPFYAQPMGVTTEEECLATCNEAENCVGADIRYPDPELALQRGETYVCFNFYASTNVDYTDCDKENFEERCYQKQCPPLASSDCSLEHTDGKCCETADQSVVTLGPMPIAECLAGCTADATCLAVNAEPTSSSNTQYTCVRIHSEQGGEAAMCEAEDDDRDGSATEDGEGGACYRKACSRRLKTASDDLNAVNDRRSQYSLPLV